MNEYKRVHGSNCVRSCDSLQNGHLWQRQIGSVVEATGLPTGRMRLSLYHLCPITSVVGIISLPFWLRDLLELSQAWE